MTEENGMIAEGEPYMALIPAGGWRVARSIR